MVNKPEDRIPDALRRKVIAERERNRRAFVRDENETRAALLAVRASYLLLIWFAMTLRRKQMTPQSPPKVISIHRGNQDIGTAPPLPPPTAPSPRHSVLLFWKAVAMVYRTGEVHCDVKVLWRDAGREIEKRERGMERAWKEARRRAKREEEERRRVWEGREWCV